MSDCKKLTTIKIDDVDIYNDTENSIDLFNDFVDHFVDIDNSLVGTGDVEFDIVDIIFLIIVCLRMGKS